MKLLGMVYLGLVILISLLTFFCYGWDKWQAKRSGRRIPEKRLHWLSLLGGWPGALLGRQLFRHKTRKTGFTMVTWLIVTAHGLLIAGFLFLLAKANWA